MTVCTINTHAIMKAADALKQREENDREMEHLIEELDDIRNRYLEKLEKLREESSKEMIPVLEEILDKMS